MKYADLEIGLHRRNVDDYAVELRFTLPDSDGESGLGQFLLPTARIDFQSLLEFEGEDAEYGRQLSQALFAAPKLREDFGRFRGVAEGRDLKLRLRLFIGPSAPELHNLRWETLADPFDPNLKLATNQNLIFSRYMSSPDARPLKLRPKSKLRAVVAIANPADLDRFGLATVDVDGELKRAQQSLGDIPITVLAKEKPVTLNNIAEAIRSTPGGCDVFYLVCHGALINGESRLWLEDQKEDGSTDPVAGSDLVLRLKELAALPRLIVLASCQSAGTGQQSLNDKDRALTALGPRLADAGVPAVLAMHGQIEMETVEKFMPTFFRELQKDGAIDRAVAIARSEVQTRFDWWMPVLFMRLRGGRVWYMPGYGEEEKSLDKWPALLNSIRDRVCTPILGPALNDTLIGSRWEIAQKLAERTQFPMSVHDRDDLPQVTQYLASFQDERTASREVMISLCQEMIERGGNDLPEELRRVKLKDLPRGKLSEVLCQLREATWRLRQKTDDAEAHTVLAKLPFSIYITTNQDSLLTKALIDAGRPPEVELCRWNEDLADISRFPTVFDPEREGGRYEPSETTPLVYHLFGRIEKLERFFTDSEEWLDLKSTVLTEDDYFDFLIGVDRKLPTKDGTPLPVGRALTDRALLFLGFQMDDWNFRVLFRYIMSKQGGRRRNKYTHVAVQINPEESRVSEPDRARRYFESYFKGADISVYWGTAEDFIKELNERCKQEGLITS